MHPTPEPAFLPLTIGVSRTAASAPEGPGRARAGEIRRCAEAADTAAAGCWAALLGGCHPAERAELPSRLRALVEAASCYTGRTWWLGGGSAHRRRVTEAQLRINDAVREGDGAEFAEAFVGYDQALATAVVSVRSAPERERLESSTP